MRLGRDFLRGVLRVDPASVGSGLGFESTVSVSEGRATTSRVDCGVKYQRVHDCRLLAELVNHRRVVISLGVILRLCERYRHCCDVLSLLAIVSAYRAH